MMLTFSRNQGITLIELLIVISLIMVVFSLVGSLSFKSLDKAKAQTELISIKNLLKKTSYQAFLNSGKYEFSTNQSQVIIKANNLKKTSTEFKYLKLGSQKLIFNSRGYPQPEQLTIQYLNKNIKVNVFRLIEGTHDFAK